MLALGHYPPFASPSGFLSRITWLIQKLLHLTINYGFDQLVRELHLPPFTTFGQFVPHPLHKSNIENKKVTAISTKKMMEHTQTQFF